jgi:uncharacterized protein (DUF433 family)
LAQVFLGYDESMAKFVTETVAGETYKYSPLGKYVVRAPEVCGGRPTFKYTRIEITGTLERLATGEQIDDIVTGYQGRVTKEAIEEAIQIVNKQFLESLPTLTAA